MFTDKITLSDQILQSTKTLLASPVIQRNSWKKTTPGHDNEDSIKENVKILIQKWKDDFPSDFQDQEALKVVETLTVTSALINSLHLKNSLERQKRLLEVKVKCFIEQTNPEMSILTSKGSPASTRKQTSMSRKDSNKHLLPSKFVLPFASTRGSEPTMIGLKVQTNVEAERNPDPRFVLPLSTGTLMNKWPLLNLLFFRQAINRLHFKSIQFLDLIKFLKLVVLVLRIKPSQISKNRKKTLW